MVPRKEALAALIGTARSVAVSGTHGKTTTTVMTTEALTAAGLSPTGIAGGRVSAWGGNARVAGDDLFVVEADEYDKAFLTLHPTVAIVNNVEPDHLECYGSMAALEDAFVEFAGRAETAHGERRRSRRAAHRRAGWGAGLAASGFSDDADVGSRTSPSTPTGPRPRSAGGTAARSGSGSASRGCTTSGTRSRRWPPPTRIGGDVDRAAEALAEFAGWGGGSSGWASTAASRWWTTTRTIRRSWRRRSRPRGRPIPAADWWPCSSRICIRARRRTGTAMGEALAAADLVVVTEVYAAREQPIAGVSGRQVAEAAQRAGADARFEPSRPDVGRRVYEALEPGDVVLTLGAGDITRVGPELVRWLGAA